MSDSPYTRLAEFRASWNDDDTIDEQSGLTARDLDVILAMLRRLDPDAARPAGPSA